MTGPQRVTLRSLGAAGTVTGSKHLLQTPAMSILVDCGLFQGIKKLRLRNWEALPVVASSIDVVLLTHAHLDHCGYLPLLVKNGFKGKVYMSAPTAELTAIILKDSARIQEEDADMANKGGYTKHTPALPLYTVADVETTLDHFITVPADTDFKLSPDISFRLTKNGHILGSCCITVHCYGKTIVFSGDIGRYHSAFMLPPEKMEGGDFVIMESTYGDRLHPTEDPADQLAAIIRHTIQHRGNVLIPSFAVGRAQEVMHLISGLKAQGKIPPSLPVFLDSPMAADVTDVLNRYPEWHCLNKGECSKMHKDVVINRDYHGTAKIIAQHGSKIVIAASGMLTGGRVLEYLKHYVTDSHNMVLLIGYQAEGTRGRALQNKAHEVRLHGKFYPVRAEVAEVTGLSGHGDQHELLQWVHDMRQKPAEIFLVHGEPAAADALRMKLEDEFHVPVHIQEEGAEMLLFECPGPKN